MGKIQATFPHDTNKQTAFQMSLSPNLLTKRSIRFRGIRVV